MVIFLSRAVHELFLPPLFLKFFFSYMPVLPLEKKQINIYFTKKKLQRVDSPTEMFLLLCSSRESSEYSDKPRHLKMRPHKWSNSSLWVAPSETML